MISISAERRCFGVFWKQERRHEQGEGEPLVIQVGGNRLRVDCQIGRDLTGSAKPGEPWVNIVLQEGPGVRVTLIGDTGDPKKTRFIVPSAPVDEVDSLSTSYRQIIVESRGCRLLGRERLVIDNSGACPRSSVPVPEEYFAVHRMQMRERSPWAVSLLKLRQYIP